MSRKKSFKEGQPIHGQVRDSRFQLRKDKKNPENIPTVFTYANPGRGQNGEHQN